MARRRSRGSGGPMFQIEITADGANALIEKFKELSMAVQTRILREAAKQGADVIAADASNKVNVLTGRLRSGIIIKKLPLRTGAGVKFGISWTRRRIAGRYVFYGYFLEKGTSKMPAKPFLRTAFAAKKDEATRVMTATIREGILRARVTR